MLRIKWTIPNGRYPEIVEHGSSSTRISNPLKCWLTRCIARPLQTRRPFTSQLPQSEERCQLEWAHVRTSRQTRSHIVTLLPFAGFRASHSGCLGCSFLCSLLARLAFPGALVDRGVSPCRSGQRHNGASLVSPFCFVSLGFLS